MRNLKYYIFDLDDNILYMPTKIKMEKYDNKWRECELSTSEFRDIRADKRYRIPLTDGIPDYNKAFEYFRNTSDSIFIKEAKEAIDNKQFAPSMPAFRECLIKGRLFGIVTARGHEPSAIQEVVEYLISTFTEKEKAVQLINLERWAIMFSKDIKKENLISDYLSLCRYIGVNSDYFHSLTANKETALNHEKAKEHAVSILTELFSVVGGRQDMEIGFSDDDRGNTDAIQKLFRDRLSKEYTNIKFTVYNTGDNIKRVCKYLFYMTNENKHF